jgi:hypothetical protein
MMNPRLYNGVSTLGFYVNFSLKGRGHRGNLRFPYLKEGLKGVSEAEPGFPFREGVVGETVGFPT